MTPLKTRVLAGEMVPAAWCDFGSADVAEAMVHNGWPVQVIDGEHGIGDLERWVGIARAIEAAGGTPILRVPEGAPALLKRVLDRGFRSIIVPMVNTAEQARQIVEACLYPGQGGARGFGAPLARAAGFGARTDYVTEAGDELLLILQCETVEAVENLAQICAVPGVGMIFIGPNDLSGSMGMLGQLAAPEFHAMLARIEATCAAAGMPLGTITGPGRGYSVLRDKGYRLAVAEADVVLLARAAAAAAQARDAELAGEGVAPTSFGY
ncbi:HpcH/HpaI aldolase family protein [Phaeovulum vinaykumarii]|uniref:4-hydroxy-2-oxoheptanedioate aldolase n=1 Tax=Phaeovulum vinaykumarii TaxID=407234 RepID=A0A1N7M8Z7_9RHOB|nr:aldolase/citrate lyase family protein [Phaeovulum vinaykumarii]SIS82441.1 4-hydroxy-2-oxoheptanedioate aldolase [Phaeovulum vinaykumarii]SOC10981.1 4-hydroxy-2-oxoheptanedioate aldolase [Phaeovulum vinaykumarii]